MQITARNLQDNLITEFSYHDAKIIKLEKSNNDVTILLEDGFNEDQVNELKFVNCKIKHKNDLKNRIIYQLDDLVNFGRTKWYMSFLVWVDAGLLEKVDIEADNIISKKYDCDKFLQEEDLNKETYDKKSNSI